MARSRIRPFAAAALLGVAPALPPLPGTAQTAPVPDEDRAAWAVMSGEELYREACASCHGVDGAGAHPALLGFEEEVPDFTDCRFARREPDADWVGVAHEGGPARGFSEMMPAFGELFDEEQLQRVMDHVRTLCADDAWPRGELNLPRALLTEKAYPEDEWVFEADAPVEGEGVEVGSAVVYEKRFGPRTQVEVVAPFGVRERAPEEGSGWTSGMGDLVLGLKHALYHSLDAGAILSVAGELKLPTGKEEDGFGSGHTVWEAFVAYGQILPGDAFLQLQGIWEHPVAAGTHDEAVLRGALGRTWTRGRWGRACSPMLEAQAKRELISGEAWSWDLVPQLQVTLNTRQHVMANVGVLVPVTDAGLRHTRLYAYLLWDWFDGGFFEGW